MRKFDKTKVLIMAKYDEEIRSALHEKFGEQCEFCFAEDKKEIPEEQLRTAEVIIGEPEEDQLQKAESLKWMQITWAGVNKYSRMKSFPEGVAFTNVSGAFGKIISEYVVGSIIALYRSFPKYWDNKKAHIWRIEDSALSVYGKKVLILGTGDLGRNVARRLQAFDAHIMGVRRNPKTGRPVVFDEIYGIDQLDEVIPQADIVIGCLPDTPETSGMMTFERLMSMKEKAILVNVGRGSLMKNNDLIRVMQSGRLLGAALDVVEGEPLAADSPLWDMENVIITPHISGPSFGGNLEIEHTIWNMCIDNLERYLKGKPLEHLVDLKAGY